MRLDAADGDRRHLPGGASRSNPRTHTVYVANAGSGKTGTVTVLDDRNCNATDQRVRDGIARPAGARRQPASAIAVNPVTDTLYVATVTSQRADRADLSCRCSTGPPATPPTPPAAVRRRIP